MRSWSEAAQKESSASKYASYKKSGKYYKITMKNISLKDKMRDTKGKLVKMNTSKSYDITQGISVTGLCRKTSAYVYVDNLKLSAKSTRQITSNKKDYAWSGGSHNDKKASTKVTTIK